MDSNLAYDLLLIALDLRGHGQSDKPHDGYSDYLHWADDIRAVITQLSLEQPVQWVVVRTYRHSGLEAALSVLTPEFLSLVPGFFSAEAEGSLHSLESLLRLCFVREPAAKDLYSMLGYNLSVPPYVRKALLSRSVDNDNCSQPSVNLSWWCTQSLRRLCPRRSLRHLRPISTIGTWSSAVETPTDTSYVRVPGAPLLNRTSFASRSASRPALRSALNCRSDDQVRQEERTREHGHPGQTVEAYGYAARHNPSCCSSFKKSRSVQRSTIFPSLNRAISIRSNSKRLPVAAKPMSGPRWVPVTVNRALT